MDAFTHKYNGITNKNIPSRGGPCGNLTSDHGTLFTSCISPIYNLSTPSMPVKARTCDDSHLLLPRPHLFHLPIKLNC